MTPPVPARPLARIRAAIDAPQGDQLPPRLQLAGFLLLLAICFAVRGVGGFDALDSKAYDLQLRVLRAMHASPIGNDVEIVGIDEASLAAFPEPFALWHRPLAQALQALTLAPPAVVGMDIVLPDKSYEFIAPGIDRVLVGGLLAARRHFPLVAAQTLQQDGSLRPVFAPYRAALGPEGLGAAVVCGDGDGVVRRYDGTLCDGGAVLPTLSARVAAHLGRSPAQLSGGWQGLIDFRIGGAFGYTPLHDLVAAAARGDTAFIERFRGKAVLIGAVLPFEDRVTLPVPLAQWEPGDRRVPGVLLHAQVLRSIGNHGFLQPVSNELAVLLLVLSCAVWFMGGSLRDLFYWPVVLGLALGGTYLLWLGVVLPEAAVLLTVNGAYTARTVADRLWRRRVARTTLSELVVRRAPSELAPLLTAAPPAEPGLRPVCVVTCRFAGLETDATTPASLLRGHAALLNRGLTIAENAFRGHDGVVQQRHDDGLRAVFDSGRPAHDARAAFEAALDLLHGVERLNAGLRAGGVDVEALSAHVGIDAGPALPLPVGTLRAHAVQHRGDAIAGAETLARRACRQHRALLIADNVTALLPALRDDARLQAAGHGDDPDAGPAWPPAAAWRFDAPPA